MSKQQVLEIINDIEENGYNPSRRDKLLKTILDLSSGEAQQLLEEIKDTRKERVLSRVGNDEDLPLRQRILMYKMFWPDYDYAESALKNLASVFDDDSTPLFLLEMKLDPIQRQQLRELKNDWKSGVIPALKNLVDKKVIDDMFLMSLADNFAGSIKKDGSQSKEAISEAFSSIIIQSDDPNIIEDAVEAWAKILPEAAERRLRRLATESPDTKVRDRAKKALVILGGEEATFAAVLDKQKSLQSYKSLLDEIRTETMRQWRNTETRAQTAFWTTTILNISTFLVGVALIVFGLYLIATSNNPTQTVSGAILSAVSAFAIAISRGFLKEPLAHITRAPAEQGLTQGAFMGFMHRLAEIQLTFETRYSENKITVEELEKFQAMVKEANQELTLHLKQAPAGIPNTTEI